jgi:hypothetical protein
MNQAVKPDFVDDETLEEYLEYLDELRESGETNMFGARPYLMDEFDLNKDEAGKVLHYWMATFGERHEEANDNP